ncbi:MAG: hypothetical protein WDZ91_01140 [Paenibacillaceae bacterium]
MINNLCRRTIRLLWHPLPFISDTVMMRILWLMPLIAFLLFIGLVASLSVVD